MGILLPHLVATNTGLVWKSTLPASPPITHPSQLRHRNPSTWGAKASRIPARTKRLQVSTPAAAGPKPHHILLLPYNKKRLFLMSPECFLVLELIFPPSAVHLLSHLCWETLIPCREDDAPTITPFRWLLKSQASSTLYFPVQMGQNSSETTMPTVGTRWDRE